MANIKLTVEQVRQIRKEYAKGKTSVRRLAAEYGISKSEIHNVVARKFWGYIA